MFTKEEDDRRCSRRVGKKWLLPTKSTFYISLKQTEQIDKKNGGNVEAAMNG